MEINKRPLTCDEACEMMFDCIDGELDKSREALLKEHIACCDSCRRELAERREILLLISASEYDAPKELYSGVMERVAAEKKKPAPLYKRLRFIPAAALVTACAAFALFVVGRGYIFGNGRADMMADAAVDYTVGNTAPERTEEASVLDGVGLYMADAALPEAVSEAELCDGAEADEEVYTATTAALTASSPLLISDYSEFSSNQSANEPAELKSKALSGAGASSAKTRLYSEFDKLFDKLSLNADSKAIIICCEDDIDFEVISSISSTESEMLTVQGSDFIHYVISNDAAKHFSEQLELLDMSDAAYRAAVPTDGDMDTFEIYILTESEK